MSEERFTNDPNRLPPIRDDSGQRHGYVCPQCGNPVTRRDNKYTCSSCKQKLLWSNFDYRPYEDALRAEKEAKVKNDIHTHPKRGSHR